MTEFCYEVFFPLAQLKKDTESKGKVKMKISGMLVSELWPVL